MRGSIFTVTVVYGNPYSRSQSDKLRVVRWGYFFDRESAESVISKNLTDISELGYYEYGVLSEVKEGVPSIPKELQWYRFIWDSNVAPRAHDGYVVPEFRGVELIDKPEKYSSIMFGGV